jgi:hypothetical protein
MTSSSSAGVCGDDVRVAGRGPVAGGSIALLLPGSSKRGIAASAAESARAPVVRRGCNWRADRELSVSLPERRYERIAQLFASALERLDDASPPAPLKEAARELGERLGSTRQVGAPGKRLIAALKAGGYEPVTDETGAIRLRNCPVPCSCQHAPSTGLRHQPGHCRRPHSRLWRHDRHASPRLPAGSLLRRVRARHREMIFTQSGGSAVHEAGRTAPVVLQEWG